jgi:hypothetical protein
MTASMTWSGDAGVCAACRAASTGVHSRSGDELLHALMRADGLDAVLLVFIFTLQLV